MKKFRNLLLGALLSLSLISVSQAQSFSEGDFVINAGIGLGTTFATYGAGGFGLPIGGGVEYGITDLETGSIGIGADIGYVGSDFVSVLTFGARGSYYLTEVFNIDNEKLDIYAGLGLYYRDYNIKGLGSAWDWGSGVYPAFHAGARYFFADNIGAYAELGNNWGWLNIGVTFKL